MKWFLRLRHTIATLRSKETVRYAGDATIHQTGYVDVETDTVGRVVAVWFRCAPVPFRQTRVQPDRVMQMNRMYAMWPPQPVVAIELEKEP